MLTLDMVYQAAHTSKNTVRKTDLIPATGLDSDCRLYLKAENLQLTGSFKLRGAYYKISCFQKKKKKKVLWHALPEIMHRAWHWQHKGAE